MSIPLQGRQADLERSPGNHVASPTLSGVVRSTPIILPPLGEPAALGTSGLTRRSVAAPSATTADRKATATASQTDGDRPDDVNKADERRSSPGGNVRQQGNGHHHDGLGDAAADGSAGTDNAILDGSCSRADNDQYRQANRENAVVVDSADATMHLNEEKESSTLTTSAINNSAQAAHTLEPLPAGATRMPLTGDVERGERGGRGGRPPSPMAGFKSRIGEGFRNFLTLGSEAQISPAPCSPLSPGDKPAPSQKQQTRATGLSPLSWGRRNILRKEKDATGKVLPASFADGPDRTADDGNRKGTQRNLDGGLESSGDLPRGTGGSGGGGGGGGAGGANDGEGKNRLEEGQAGGEEAAAANAAGSHRDSGRGGGSEARLREGVEVDYKEAEEAEGLARVTASGDDGVATGSKTEGATDGSVVPVDAKDAAATPPRGHGPRALARDNTLVASDQWPSPLDDEADPDDWALDKSEADVLAAARRMGSVLVRVVTWNLHAKPTPSVEKLRETLLPPGKFHIYAIGTEECLNSIAKSVIVHSKKEWESTAKEILGSSYEMLCGHALQATHNTVFAHRGIVPLLRNVRSSAVATGLSLGAPGTTLGNKGGVGISFNLGATSCIFVNSHLAAHQTNVRERNDHFFQISSELVRELGPGPTAPCGPRVKGEPLAATVSSSIPLDASSPSPVTATGNGGCDSGGGGGGGGGEGLSLSPAGTADTDSKSQDPGEHQGVCAEQPPLSRPASETAGAPPDHAQQTLPPSQAVTLSPNETVNQSQHPSVEAASTKPKTKTDLADLECESKESEAAGSTPPLSPYPAAAQQQQQQQQHQQQEKQQQEQQPEDLPTPSSRGVSIGHPLRRAGAERIGGASNSSSSAGRPRGGRGGERSTSNSNSNTLPEVFDRVVWAGDLNYRVNVPRGVADLLLSRDMHGVLLKNEQLTIERDRGGPLAPFAGYREGPLNFRPTYKFDSGSDTYDTSSKRRVPAWTDRILFASAAAQTGRGKEEEEGQGQQEQRERGREELEGGEQEEALVADRLHLRAYRSVPDLRTSDHRPVIASFVLEFDQQGDGNDADSGVAAVTNQTSSEICAIM